MKVYLDLLFILNFGFDFLLLLSLGLVAKRKIKISKLLLAALIGALSIFILFIKINSLELFLLKFGISILMLFISYGYKDIKYFLVNILYLYMLSILLGGFLYFLNVQFSYKNIGLVFFHKNISINFILLIIISPLILYIYIRQARYQKQVLNNIYDVKIKYNQKEYNLKGFLDTGHNLTSPYSNRPVIVVFNSAIDEIGSIVVPIKTANNKSLLACFKPDLVMIDGVSVEALVGVIKDKLDIEGVDCLLSSKILEGIYDQANN